MTLSAYFKSKSVFDVQGCRALTLALARLSFNTGYCQGQMPMKVVWAVDLLYGTQRRPTCEQHNNVPYVVVLDLFYKWQM